MDRSKRIASLGRVALTIATFVSCTVAATAESPRGTIQLSAVIRDFKAIHESGGHNDFQAFTGTVRVGLLADQLGPDGKPVLVSTQGWKIVEPYRDLDGNPVRPQFVIDGTVPGIPGELEERFDSIIFSDDSFASWYRDVPGINMSTVVPVTLVETAAGSGVFVFDSNAPDPVHHPEYVDLPHAGFFPINDSLHGNYPDFDGGSTNFHFTTEIATTFPYERGLGHHVTFAGDDDVWVFIDGKLVIDLGGVHGATTQTIHLDHLPWLDGGDGEHTLHIFHAERRTGSSNFRMETTLPLRPYRTVETSEAFD